MCNKRFFLLILHLFCSVGTFTLSAGNPSDYFEVRDQGKAASYPDSARKELKNNIYPGISLGLLWGSWNINYERKLFNFSSTGESLVYLRAACGAWGGWGASGTGGLLSVNILPSNKPHHFEFGLGAAILLVTDRFAYYADPNDPPPEYDNLWILPSINIGYRYQHLYKNFFYRVGASFPEGAYMGLGVHF